MDVLHHHAGAGDAIHLLLGKGVVWFTRLASNVLKEKLKYLTLPLCCRIRTDVKNCAASFPRQAQPVAAICG